VKTLENAKMTVLQGETREEKFLFFDILLSFVSLYESRSEVDVPIEMINIR
jgi:hypothetical protein